MWVIPYFFVMERDSIANTPRKKSYTVGIPKLLSFDIIVHKKSRESDKRTPRKEDEVVNHSTPVPPPM